MSPHEIYTATFYDEAEGSAFAVISTKDIVQHEKPRFQPLMITERQFTTGILPSRVTISSWKCVFWSWMIERTPRLGCYNKAGL